ncbi:hypothetical protein QJQ45_007331 [Haematococcus lacustris]|nr:hypothetical protein QJQ45_007331 [Haematococcus lacustris]
MLIDLASARYQDLRGSCMPQLPALEDRVADGTPAVDLCLRRNNHQQEEHADRALFNIVTGSAEAMKRLHFSSTAVPGMASAEGAVVLIPGMTSALLLAHEDGSLSMPPKHSVDAPTSLAEQLTVVAVCVRADIPVRVLCWTSLQQALVGCFAITNQPQPQARPAVGAKLEAVPQVNRARTEDVPTGPVLWSLFVKTLTGKRHHVHSLHGASLVRDLKKAVQDIDGMGWISGSWQLAQTLVYQLQGKRGQGQAEYMWAQGHCSFLQEAAALSWSCTAWGTQRWETRKRVVTFGFFGNAGIGTRAGWGAKALLQAYRKVVKRSNSGKPTGRLPGKVVMVDEFCSNRVSSAMNCPQPCEAELDCSKPTRPEGWKQDWSGQVHTSQAEADAGHEGS